MSVKTLKDFEKELRTKETSLNLKEKLMKILQEFYLLKRLNYGIKLELKVIAGLK